ncbi:MAG: nucleoside phosphatase [Gammaproteobacteria bacterium]|nr:nucleoside phosphatase [Gammaproteobacteria bacterium]
MPGNLISVLVLVSLFLGACTRQVEPDPATTDLPACHIIYDAGSKGTRLYVYEQTDIGWLKHAGPKVGALADPVRKIRGRTMADAGAVVDDIATALENVRFDGPPNNSGEPKWSAFDWREQCDIESVSVYATAGMRLAEQMDSQGSEVLWKLLNQRLGAAVGMDVTTRTLSGFEEGLFAWLATRENRDDDNFGVAEMGGASIQVAFPCPQCQAARQVKAKGQQVAIYSYSFLGWGQDEAWNKFGSSKACERGVGVENLEWQVVDCSDGIGGFTDTAFVIANNIRAAETQHWFLSGAFRYMKDDDIDRFCRKGVDSGFEPDSSCFRAVYLQSVLDTLGLPVDADHSDVDWTLGAVVCTAAECLRE